MRPGERQRESGEKGNSMNAVEGSGREGKDKGKEKNISDRQSETGFYTGRAREKEEMSEGGG